MQNGFSLKWLLLGVTYAALAAAACSQQGKLWEQFLWLLTGLVTAYAVLAACLLAGRARAMALGFSLFALSYGAALWWFPAMSPVTFVAYARGFDDPAGQDMTERAQSRRLSMAYELRIALQAANEEYRERAKRQSEALKLREDFYARLEALEGSTNAIGIAGIGLLGLVLAARLAATGSPTRAAEEESRHPLDDADPGSD